MYPLILLRTGDVVAVREKSKSLEAVVESLGAKAGKEISLVRVGWQ